MRFSGDQDRRLQAPGRKNLQLRSEKLPIGTLAADGESCQIEGHVDVSGLPGGDRGGAAPDLIARLNDGAIVTRRNCRAIDAGADFAQQGQSAQADGGRYEGHFKFKRDASTAWQARRHLDFTGGDADLSQRRLPGVYFDSVLPRCLHENPAERGSDIVKTRRKGNAFVADLKA